MTMIEASAFIQRTVSDVFAFVSDQRNAVRWQAGLVEVTRLTEAPVGVGTRHRFVRKLMGRKMAADNEYVAYEPDVAVTFRTITGPVQLQASYLTAASGDGTDLTCRMDLTRGSGLSGLFHPLMVRSIKKQMSADFLTLKRLLETGC